MGIRRRHKNVKDNLLRRKNYVSTMIHKCTYTVCMCRSMGEGACDDRCDNYLLKYNDTLCLSIFILFYVTLYFHCSLEDNIVLFTHLHLFDSFIY